MGAIHFATVVWPEGRTDHFASLDGLLFLGVTKIPTPEDIPAVQAIFEQTVGQRTLPMRVHRDLLASYDATFGFVADEPPHTAKPVRQGS